MLVFWKERLVLLSVPKTGTQAYQQALGPRASLVVSDPPELKHAPLYRYNRFFRPMFEKMGADDLDLVAVIRDPMDWLGSWYRYRQRAALDGRPVSTKGLSFDAFLRASCEARPPACANVGYQSKFVEARPNGVSVRHLFRYEDQEGLKAFLSSRLGDLPQIAPVNVSPAQTLTASADTQALVRTARHADFALWESIPIGGTR
ncbi:gamma-glutamyl kinase [Marivita sp. S0852]|uniref:gamma-glutamyl kinase n=1 Tax=Marivita sp. S0852 TaxID=3373893 RepID=UPI003982630C